jgi:hypothetical protein
MILPRRPVLLLGIALLAAVDTGSLWAQTSVDQETMRLHHHSAVAAGKDPSLGGQDAFAALQEVVQLLEADPSTDWTKVELEHLRQHLIDMNAVTLGAAVEQHPVEGGIEAVVTGSGRVLDAIRRMVPAHLQVIESTHLHGWHSKVENVPEGVIVTVTATDPAEVSRLIGVMVSGDHHRQHHMALARGDVVH